MYTYKKSPTELHTGTNILQDTVGSIQLNSAYLLNYSASSTFINKANNEVSVFRIKIFNFNILTS